MYFEIPLGDPLRLCSVVVYTHSEEQPLSMIRMFQRNF